MDNPNLRRLTPSEIKKMKDFAAAVRNAAPQGAGVVCIFQMNTEDGGHIISHVTNIKDDDDVELLIAHWWQSLSSATARQDEPCVIPLPKPS